MSTKQLAWLVAGSVVLLILGSLGGAAMYAKLFAPEVVYVEREAVPTAFSPMTQSSVARAHQGEELPSREELRLPAVGAYPSFVNASNLARPAVVHIKSSFGRRSQSGNSDFFSNPFKDFFDDDMGEIPQSLASGSGVLISADGYIATNNHVIQDASEVEVTLFDNRTFPARVIGTDLSTDLALIKIDGKALPHLSFGDSDQVEVGQWVLAVGNPMDLTSTVTAGIVSAKGRNINLLRNDSEYAIESFIQTDAAVNKGNSGGALVDDAGNLIGINTAIASRTGYYAGYSFAIPATIAQKVMEDLLAYGEVRRGYLGVSIRPVNSDLAEAKDLRVLKGAYVTEVNPELGAYQVGIRRGDVIVSVNQVPVNSSSELQEQVSRYRPGDRIEVRLFRGKKEMSFRVPLKGLETDRVIALRSSLEFRGNLFRLPSRDELRKLDVDAGIMVEEAGETMSRNGVQKGFVITGIDGETIRSIEDLERAFEQSGDYLTIKGLYSKGMVASYSFRW